MSPKEEYQTCISELLNTYGEHATAEWLGVTTRSLYNYLSKTKPTIPHDRTLRSLKEIFERHRNGELKASEQKRVEDPKDKIIELQEQQIALLKEHVNVKTEALNDYKNKLSISAQELQKQAIINQAYLKTILQVQARMVAALEKSKTSEEIQIEINALLGEALTGAS